MEEFFKYFYNDNRFKWVRKKDYLKDHDELPYGVATIVHCETEKYINDIDWNSFTWEEAIKKCRQKNKENDSIYLNPYIYETYEPVINKKGN